MAKAIFILTASCLVLLAGCSAANRHAVQPVRVQGVAMEPSLNDGERILLSRDVNGLQRGDIVAFYYPEDQTKSYIKRVVGLPHEEIEIRGGKLLINGQLYEESYVLLENNQASLNHKPVKVPEGNFYVLGDNRDKSSDSRFWGTVPQHLIYGKFMNKY